MTTHAGVVAGQDCPACGPVLTEARRTQASWERAQLQGRKSAEVADAERRVAAAALLAAKQEHYR